MKYPHLALLCFLPLIAFGQPKYDAHWTIGYDTSSIDPGGDVILMNFNLEPVEVKTVKTVDNFFGFAALATMSDAEGRLLFYTSGCYVVNTAHEIMENGDSINPEYEQQYDCPGGSSNNVSGQDITTRKTGDTTLRSCKPRPRHRTKTWIAFGAPSQQSRNESQRVVWWLSILLSRNPCRSPNTSYTYEWTVAKMHSTFVPRCCKKDTSANQNATIGTLAAPGEVNLCCFNNGFKPIHSSL